MSGETVLLIYNLVEKYSIYLVCCRTGFFSPKKSTCY